MFVKFYLDEFYEGQEVHYLPPGGGFEVKFYGLRNGVEIMIVAITRGGSRSYFYAHVREPD